MLHDRTPTVDIIIVNWNSGPYLQRCVESIERALSSKFVIQRVVIIDNASKDDSINNLGVFNLPLVILRNDVNRGFAAACNQGAKGSKADYLLFLNPDVELFENSLSVPLVFMEQPENEKIGIVGVQLVDHEGRVARTCARFPTPSRFFARILGLDKLFPSLFPSHFMKEWDHTETRVVDHVMGAFFLVRRSLFEALGGFDERFFVYMEDVDFSLRARQAGWTSVYLAEAKVYHKGGGTTEQIKAVRLFYSLRSRMLYAYKHFSWGAATSIALATLLVELVTRLIWAIVRCSGKEIIETVKGYSMLWKWVLMLLKKKIKRRKT